MPNISEMLWIAGIALIVALVAIWLANNVDFVKSLTSSGGGFLGIFG